MRDHLLKLLLTTVIFCAASTAGAERPNEDRAKADFVVDGMVKGVYTRDEGYYHHYIVELVIDKVEKGKDLATGRTLYVYSFDRKKNAPSEPSASGHENPPKKGLLIKAFVKDGKGRHEAIYQDWYDELQTADSKRAGR